MMDNLTPEQRRTAMARIGSRHTSPEIAVRRLLHAHGFRFRLHRKDLPGSPDIFLPKYKTAVFVHGCFWHGHAGCRRAALPKTRTEFWRRKIARSAVRDQEVTRALETRGVQVIVVWQCELRSVQSLATRLVEALRARLKTL